MEIVRAPVLAMSLNNVIFLANFAVFRFYRPLPAVISAFEIYCPPLSVTIGRC